MLAKPCSERVERRTGKRGDLLYPAAGIAQSTI